MCRASQNSPRLPAKDRGARLCAMGLDQLEDDSVPCTPATSSPSCSPLFAPCPDIPTRLGHWVLLNTCDLKGSSGCCGHWLQGVSWNGFLFLCAHNEEFLPLLVNDLFGDLSFNCNGKNLPNSQNVAGSVSEVTGKLVAIQSDQVVTNQCVTSALTA